MALETQASILTKLRIQIKDPLAAVWDDPTANDAIERAIRSTFPAWYEPVTNLDYTAEGSAGVLAQFAESVAIPADFLATTGRGPGAIWEIFTRDYPATGPYTNSPWSEITKGVRLDPTNQPSPLIRFRYPCYLEQEIMLIGGRPITVPSAAGDSIICSDLPGFVEYVCWRAEEFLRAEVQKAPQHDRRDHRSRRLLAGQKADEIKAAFGMGHTESIFEF